MSSFLSSAAYGKDNVRVLKVKRDPTDPSKQEVIEMTVQVLLEGEIETSYTNADNSSIVPTDTVKNTVHILAKQTDVWPIERFAATLADHFTSKYNHIHKATAHIIQHRWTRYNVDGAPHPHSFIQDGTEVRIAQVSKSDTKNSKFHIKSGIKDLTVLKSTGSMFYGYNVCDYTTLKPTTDRILSTDVDASWEWNPAAFTNIRDVDYHANAGLFDNSYNAARTTTLRTFALENSASVQATMYNISTEIIKKVDLINAVTFSLPNKHYVNVDLSWHKGIKNLGKDAEIFIPTSDPNGLIKSTVTRKPAAKL